MGRYYIAIEGFEKALQFYKRLLKLKPDEKEFEEIATRRIDKKPNYAKLSP